MTKTTRFEAPRVCIVCKTHTPPAGQQGCDTCRNLWRQVIDTQQLAALISVGPTLFGPPGDTVDRTLEAFDTWAHERLRKDPAHSVETSALAEDFQRWLLAHNYQPATLEAIARRLAKWCRARGFRVRKRSRMVVDGLAFRGTPEAAQ